MLRIRYLHEKPLFRTPPLRIRGIGIRERMPPCFISRPGGTGDALFMLFHSAVRIGTDPASPLLPEGTAIFWTPEMGHHYGSMAERWSHSWIHCDGERLRAACRAARLVPGRPLQPRDPSRVERYLFDIHGELSGSSSRPDGIILGNLLENLLREAARTGPSRAKAAPPGLLRAKERIDAAYEHPLTLDALARLAGLSVPHFCTAFRRSFGFTPISYLLQRRMEVASALVRGTGLPLGEVGRSVGCPDPYYFSKLFRKHFGIPPSRLRREKA
ncbi:AraC-type DNA-binding protein [Verrucomicrobium sp. GAS474]|uniref:helix-turn-helix transcriptional regulator n=1 Tax=Verrucomicrobium sp. GAS474 TaxID=1882831 RepID=UPI00087AD020|nr:AraC family transcriptional regulator [Verrucomicrobium sp. GAS474]SDU30346.1 AraC-type DNA-binding protein [Verrucomicrobium sp. GAS474]